MSSDNPEWPDVMRGEEVLVLGDDAKDLQRGTHSKWIALERGHIVSVRTAMAGEIVAMLARDGTLAPFLREPVRLSDSSRAGVRRSLSGGDLLNALFGTRAAVLLGRLKPSDAASYVSGVLIGADVAEIAQHGAGLVRLIGEGDLASLYAAALTQAGVGVTPRIHHGVRRRSPGDPEPAMTDPITFDTARERCLLVAILRGIRPEEAVDVADALLDAGFTMIEVPLNSPEPLLSIMHIAAHCGERAIVAGGTMLTAGDLHAVRDAGSRLMVSPNTDPRVIAAPVASDMIAIPGFGTPSEMFDALQAGATALKQFPAEMYRKHGLFHRLLRPLS